MSLTPTNICSIMKEINDILTKCTSCGHEARFVQDGLEEWLGAHHTLADLQGVYDRFACRNCGERQPIITGAAGKKLFDPNEQQRCAACNQPIPIPRAVAMPNTTLCTVCAAGQHSPTPAKPKGQLKGSKPGTARTGSTPVRRKKPPAVTCGWCGERAVVRRNSRDRSPFYGCETYPKCNWTSPFNPKP